MQTLSVLPTFQYFVVTNVEVDYHDDRVISVKVAFHRCGWLMVVEKALDVIVSCCHRTCLNALYYYYYPVLTL